MITLYQGAAVPFAEDIMEKITDAVAALSSAYVFEGARMNLHLVELLSNSNLCLPRPSIS